MRRRKNSAICPFSRPQISHTKKQLKKGQTQTSHKHNKLVEYAIAAQVSKIFHSEQATVEKIELTRYAVKI